MNRLCFILCVNCAFLSFLQAQPTPNKLTVERALRMAEANYPLLKSKRLDAQAAGKNVDLSKHSIVPSLDISYQANLATANNITGMFYPPGMIPMTGPVFSDNNYNPGFGSAASLLLNWQPLTFGARTADTRMSAAEAAVRSADYQNELFREKVDVISAYLDVLLASALIDVHEKNLDRSAFNLNESRVLTASGLRPGVDTALFLAELSKARINIINAKKYLQAQQISLSRLLVNDSVYMLTDSLFFNRVPVKTTVNANTAQHPLLLLSQSELAWSKSREQVLNKYWLPKLNVWATGFARGSGIYPDGTIKAIDGLGFSKYNYGLGLQLAFPILKYSEAKIQQQQQHFVTQAKEELINQTSLELSKQMENANLNLQAALDIVKETPIQFSSASYAFGALQIRYKTGLVNFADLVQSQYSLVKSETDLKESYWEVWKALLYKAAVSGNLDIFLTELK